MDKGERFLELIDEQSSIQRKMASKVSALISAGWESESIRGELEQMASRCEEITKELDG